MSMIYEPTGKAREYGELAANPYTGCNHQCKYCYAPLIRRMKRENYGSPSLRRNFLRDFEKDCKKYYSTEKPLFFSFMTDPYNNLDSELKIMREALKLCLKYKIPVKILTKSKTVLNDIDVIKKFKNHISVGMTLTFDNVGDSKTWEPGASLPGERIDTLNTLKAEGVHTWASFEPVIDPFQSLKMIDNSINVVDHYKIGKLNNYQGVDKTVNWIVFLNEVTIKLRGKKPFYIKQDLRKAAPGISLYGNEILPDEFNPEPWGIDGKS